MKLAIEIHSHSETGPHRPRNEDVARVTGDGRVMIVADGLGGAAAGDQAARIATEVIERFLADELDAPSAIKALLPASSSRDLLLSITPGNELLADPGERLRFAILLAHTAVLAEGRTSGCVGMSTALVVAWLAASGWIIAHVGDCRAYVLDQGGLRLLTRDHSLSTALTGRRSLPDHGEDSSFLRSRLTQVIGGEQVPTPDLASWSPSAECRLLLCTDGVWGHLSEREISAHLGDGMTTETMSRRLVAAAIDAGSRDNATSLVARF